MTIRKKVFGSLLSILFVAIAACSTTNPLQEGYKATENKSDFAFKAEATNIDNIIQTSYSSSYGSRTVFAALGKNLYNPRVFVAAKDLWGKCLPAASVVAMMQFVPEEKIDSTTKASLKASFQRAGVNIEGFSSYSKNTSSVRPAVYKYTNTNYFIKEFHYNVAANKINSSSLVTTGFLPTNFAGGCSYTLPK